MRLNLRTVILSLSLIALAACIMPTGCDTSQKQAALDEFITQTRTDLGQMQQSVRVANEAAHQAFGQAVSATDRANALKQVELTDKQLDVLNKAVAGADLAANGVKGAGGDPVAREATVAGVAALAAPLGPWAPLVGLGVSGVLNLIQVRRELQAKKDAAAALAAQVTIANHALTPSVSPADIKAHTSTVLGDLSDGAKAIYDAADPIAVTTSAGPVAI